MNPARRIVVLLLLLLFSACTRQLSLVTGDRQVVVDCVLTEKPQQILYLSLTNGTSGIGPEALDDAVATLTDLTESQVAGRFVQRPDKTAWTLDYAALPKHSYRLEIEVPGYGTVREEDTMPPAVDVSYTRGAFDQLDVKDPAYFYHYYDILIRLTGDPLFTFEIGNIFYQSASLPDHLIIEGYVYDDLSRSHKLSEMMCTDCPGVNDVNLRGDVYVSDIMNTVYLNDITESKTYFFINKLNPPLDGAGCHERYLKIEKSQALNQEYFAVSGDFRLQRGFGNFGSEYVPRSETDEYLLFTALSDDYSRYLDEAGILWKRSRSNLLSDRYVRDAPFSNIEGGVGILGATTAQILPVAQTYTRWGMYVQTK